MVMFMLLLMPVMSVIVKRKDIVKMEKLCDALTVEGNILLIVVVQKILPVVVGLVIYQGE